MKKKKNSETKQKHSTFGEKGRPRLKRANPLKGSQINANEWERGQMERKQANVFLLLLIEKIQQAFVERKDKLNLS